MHYLRWRAHGSLTYCECEKHGKTDSKEYLTWMNMRRRCYEFGRPDFSSYLGKGIKVCERWENSFNNFFEDMGEKPKGMTLERIDNNGDYSKGNCKWASTKEQNRNKSNNKLNENKVKEVIKLHTQGFSQTEIAEQFEVTKSMICNIMNGRAWRDIVIATRKVGR